MWIPCIPKELPPELHIEAASSAIALNPHNAPPHQLRGVLPPQRLALLTSRYWGASGVKLSVQFLSPVSAAVRDRILEHMNAWRTDAQANVSFAWTQQAGDVRISFAATGYWSYIGTDIRHVNGATMNLQGFDSETNPPPESEWRRVVRHETGHSLGFPHEHQRPEIIALLDPAKVIAFAAAHYGWSAQMATEQILTPLDPADLTVIGPPDFTSIMDYGFSGEETKSGQPIPGGADIDAGDKALASKVYPLPGQPPPPPPPPPTPTTPGRVVLARGLAHGQTYFYNVHMQPLGVFQMGDHPKPPGQYLLAPLTGGEMSAINWQAWLARVEAVLKRWGPLAAPIVEALIDQTSLPAEIKAALDALIQAAVKAA